eukprot:GFYU01014196.1.p1 GENE.GFYU01014196.1~~GFYU01014196.1.p1  ORF type:complete len:279 (+),score=111.51 GFYU01014196.1:128-964(+)
MPPRRKKKDPAAPKKALTAFILFATDHRPRLKEQYPGIKFGDVAKKLSEMWEKVTDEERKKYEEMARKDKERYEIEKEEYNKQKALEPSGRRRRKDPDAPKHSLNPFMFFAQEQREKIKAELPEGLRVNTILGERWRGMDDAEKKKYVDLSNADRERYHNEKQQYLVARHEQQREAEAQAAAEAAEAAEAAGVHHQHHEHLQDGMGHEMEEHVDYGHGDGLEHHGHVEHERYEEDDGRYGEEYEQNADQGHYDMQHHDPNDLANLNVPGVVDHELQQG